TPRPRPVPEAGGTMEDMTTEPAEGVARGATPSAAPAGTHDSGFAFRWAYGNPDAPFTIVEFGDLECPYCGPAKPVLTGLVSGSEGQIRMLWRRYPLFEVQTYAHTAASAAEADGNLGVCWPVTKLLFTTLIQLQDASVARYVNEFSLDMESR